MDRGILRETVLAMGPPEWLDLTTYERNNLVGRAIDQINALCLGRVLASQLTPFQEENVEKAVCRHADFMLTYGQALEAPLESYGINGVNMSFATDKVFQQGGTTTSREVYSLLLPTGLLYRGCVG